MKKIAFLVDEVFSDSEFRVPYDRLCAAGYVVEIIGLEYGRVIVGQEGKEQVTVEKAVDEVSEHQYRALVILGDYSPEHLRMHADAVRFTRAMARANKPIAAMCHASRMLIEADLADDRWLTSRPSLQADLAEAGGRWLDREVVVDGNIITSRSPDDAQAFSDAILHQLAEGVPLRADPIAEIGPEPMWH